MKKFNRSLGKKGEGIAADYLTKKGFKIIERNYHTRFGEIDLVCSRNNNLVFVEVKLKQGEDFGTPEEMIDRQKLSQVNKMADFYLMDNPQISGKYAIFSIDAVCIVIGKNDKVERINHYKNLTF